MRKLVVVLGVFLLSSIAVLAQQKEIDTDLSKIEWLGKKVTGQHKGDISFKSGYVNYEGKNITGGVLVVDMNSITCTDLTNADYNAKLVGHLKSDDFFGVASNPYSELKITNASKAGNKYAVKASLTIKGKTHPVEFTVTEAGGKLTGIIKVDRTLYDVRYGSGKFFDDLGDKMIYDIFELTFNVLLK